LGCIAAGVLVPDHYCSGSEAPSTSWGFPCLVERQGHLFAELGDAAAFQSSGLGEAILYLSLYFKQHRPAYYDLLDRVRVTGDWETWLEFFLTGVRDTAEQAAAAARRIVAVFEEHRHKIEALGRPAASALRVFEHLQRHPIVSISATARSIGVSAPTVAKSLEHMRQLGMLREITGRQRHRLFVYHAYLAILNEGTEPIR
jgi:Fic family protein